MIAGSPQVPERSQVLLSSRSERHGRSVKIAVAGKGGSGKTTISGTLARSLARSGLRVLALDCDANPMLGISLGVGPEKTDRLLAVRQAVEEGEEEHQPTIEGIIREFGTDAPDGIRLVVVSRIDNIDPG